MFRLTHLRCHCCIEGADHVHLNLGSGGSGIVTKFATLAFTVIYILSRVFWLTKLTMKRSGYLLKWMELQVSWLGSLPCHLQTRHSCTQSLLQHPYKGEAEAGACSSMKSWDTSNIPKKRRGSQRAEDHTIKCLPDSGLNGSEPSRTRSASLRLWTNSDFPQILHWLSFQVKLQTMIDLSKLAFASEETISYLLLDRLQFKRCMLGKNDVCAGSYLSCQRSIPSSEMLSGEEIACHVTDQNQHCKHSCKCDNHAIDI